VKTKTTSAGFAALSLSLFAACGSDSKSASSTAVTTPATTATTATTVAPATTTRASTTIAPTTTKPSATTTTAASTTTTSPATVPPTTTAVTTTTQSGIVGISVIVGTDSSPDRVEHVPLGATVTLELTDPNAEQEYHVHDYDLGGSTEVPAGTTSRITFVADKAGTFEVESHITEDVLVQLQVS
jgi:hypothetical protein